VTFPHALGLDAAGIVAERGEGVEAPTVGKAVIGFLPMTGPGAGRVVLMPVIGPRWRGLFVATGRGARPGPSKLQVPAQKTSIL
jgi:hypothetical protein